MIDTRNQYDGAFTRIELLTVVAVIGLLALTQLAGFARHGEISKAAICLNNLSQLQRAWQLYAEDWSGTVPSCDFPRTSIAPEWAGGGWLDYSPDPENWDPAVSLKTGALWNYTSQNAELWRCPADMSTVNRRGEIVPRVRSYSMNSWINGLAWPNYSQLSVKSINQLYNPGPAKTFLLMDEHPGSINDNQLLIDMDGYPNTPRAREIIDYPASHHAGGAGVVFTDGHAELKRWSDLRTTPVFRNGQTLPLVVRSPENPDVLWLQERTPLIGPLSTTF